MSATTATPLPRLTASPTVQSATLLALHPTITASRPANGSTNVPRYAFVALDVHLVSAGHGINTATANTDNLKLNRASDGQFVNCNITVDAGGGAVTITPTALLAANTRYVFKVTSGLKDTAGNTFAPFQMSFTTGTQVPSQDKNIVFKKTNQSTTLGHKFASLAWGPDNKLYAGTLDGAIMRFPVSSSGTLGTGQVISTVNNANHQKRFIIGLEFDPKSTASNPILWVSHSQATDLTLNNAPDWTGKISRLSGSNLSTYKDYVVGLPRSVRDHVTDQLHFGPDGALYFCQPSMNAMGAPDPEWLRKDHPLSGAVLRVDLTKIKTAPVNVKTPDGGGTYNPSATNAPVTVYATGVRNGYDFVFASNGHLYMPANGSAAGGNTPAGPGGKPKAMTNVQLTMHDYVFDIKKGGYYGQPNLTRGQYILNGGNPTSGKDRNEVTAYPVGTKPDPNYRGSIFDFGQNYAPTGVIQYKGGAFGGRLNNRLLVCRYSGGDDVFILTPGSTGSTMTGTSGVGMDGLNDPTDIVEDRRTGNLYVSQLGTDKSGMPRNLITLLKPAAATTTPATTTAAALALQNLDTIPGNERMIFNRINHLDTKVPNVVHDKAKLRLKNTGGQTLKISSLKFSGPWKIVGTAPTSIAAGKWVDLTIQFTATKPPTYTYNQTNWTTNKTLGGAYVGSLTINSNDPAHPKQVEQLAGWFQDRSENNEEPSLQTVLNLIANYKTNIAAGHVNTLPETSGKKLYGEEVNSAYWRAADSTKSVWIRQIASFHSQGYPVNLSWYGKGSTTTHHLFTTAASEGQSFLPHIQGSSTTPAAGTFKPGTGTVGFKIDNEWSDDKKNYQAGGGHHVRFYPVRDHNGKVIANTYFMCLDYSVKGAGAAAENFDFQDAVYVVSNVRPAGN